MLLGLAPTVKIKLIIPLLYVLYVRIRNADRAAAVNW